MEKIVDETDGNPYPLPYFREQDLAAEDARAARISNAMTRKVALDVYKRQGMYVPSCAHA